MATPSNIYMNWSNVQWTDGTTTVVFAETVSLQVQRGGEAKRWFADGTPHARAIANKNRTRAVTIHGGAINLYAQIPEDTAGTLTATLADFRNGPTGAGALTLTLANATLMHNPFTGSNNDYATGDLTLEGFKPDGTDPLTIAAVAGP